MKNQIKSAALLAVIVAFSGIASADERKWLAERESLKSDPDAFVVFRKKRIEKLTAIMGNSEGFRLL